MIDPNSQTWAAIKAHCEAQIERSAARLEIPGLSMPETENERGAIKALKGLLDLARPKPDRKIGGTIDY